MSILKDVAIRTSIEDFTKARDETLRLLEQGMRLCRLARATSEKHVRYGFPHDALPRIDLEEARREIDARWWRHCFRWTGLVKLMDEQATREFENSLKDDCPEFTLENIQTMVLSMYQQQDELFLRGMFNVFRQLNRNYRTNDRQRFEVGRKIIITCLFDTWWSGQGRLRVSHYKRAMLNDIDRCICVLMDEPYQEYSLEAAIQEALEDDDVFENQHLKIRGFRNGNGHLYFKDKKLLRKINQCIADYCGPALAEEAS